MNKIDLGKIFKYFLLKWNIILASISVLGVLVLCIIIPLITENVTELENNSWLKFFVFLGMNAIVWTLIEIKLKLDKKPSTPERFDDLRDARPHILEHICQCMKANKSEELLIEFVGGRIRTISDIIREIISKIEKDVINTRNVKIIIYAANPNFIKCWNFSSNKEDYVTSINSSKKEFLKCNESEIFKANKIKIEVEFYDIFPHFYFCKIGNKHIYWGFFSWCEADKDFKGENPCYYLGNKHSHFTDFSNILSNRMIFFQNCKMKKDWNF